MPRPGSTLVHPRLRTDLAPRHFPDSGRVEQLPTENLNTLNDPTAQADWAVVTGLEVIPCLIAPLSLKRGDEVRTVKTTFVATEFYIYLAGSFPQITERMRFVVSRSTGELVFDILSVFVDPLQQFTKLEGQIIR